MIQDIYPQQFDNTFKPTTSIAEDDYVFYFKGDELLLKHGEVLMIPKKKDLHNCPSEGVFLFTLNQTPCFLILDRPLAGGEHLVFHEIKFRNLISEREIDWVSSVALQLKNWYLEHKFCGKCGHATILKSDERAVLCPSCHTFVFPSISPAIIVAITCQDKLLMARGAQFPEGYFSLVAGYTEVGETIEQTIIREAKEEVGLDVKNIRFYKSQPWPFSGSIMLGFFAEADESQVIHIDNTEIVEADWYSRENLPNHPSNRSIAGELIEKYVARDF